MWRMWEHVDGLYRYNTIVNIQQLQITSLCGWVARYIDNTFRSRIQNGSYHIGVHAGTWRVSDDDIRTSVLSDEVVCQNILHVACIEQGVGNAVDFRVDFGILNSFWHVFDADNLLGVLCHEVGNGASTCVKVVDERFDV